MAIPNPIGGGLAQVDVLNPWGSYFHSLYWRQAHLPLHFGVDCDSRSRVYSRRSVGRCIGCGPVAPCGMSSLLDITMIIGAQVGRVQIDESTRLTAPFSHHHILRHLTSLRCAENHFATGDKMKPASSPWGESYEFDHQRVPADTEARRQSRQSTCDRRYSPRWAHSPHSTEAHRSRSRMTEGWACTLAPVTMNDAVRLGPGCILSVNR